MAKAKKKVPAKKTAKKAVKKSAAKKPVKKAVKKVAKQAVLKTVKKAVVKKSSVKPVPKISQKSLDQLGLNPLADRLIVKIDVAEKRTAGGLYIPDTAQVSGNYRGQVLAVGRGSTSKKGFFRPMDVRAGDEILFSEYAGSKMTIDGFDVLILRETDVLGVVEK